MSKPLLSELAKRAADADNARVAAKRARDPELACLHEGGAAAYKQAGDLATTAIAELVVERSRATDPGVRKGLADAIRHLGGSV